MLNRFIENATRKSKTKISIVRLYLRLLSQDRFNRYSPFSSLRRPFFDILYKECSDSQLIVDTLKVFNFEMWTISENDPCQLEFFLHHVHTLKKEKEFLRTDMIHFCLAESLYKNVEILFKYQDAPRKSLQSYQQTVSRLRNKGLGLPEGASTIPVEDGIATKDRHFLILQIFAIFFTGRSDGLKALQMIWRSIPDPAIHLTELASLFPALRDTECIDEIHRFVKHITGEESLVHQPRKLKHFCRITIRKGLSENRNLFTGIGKLGLPSSLQLFIRLEN
ncbi:hypothetical protein HNY73_017692 [Argiope bruennichi]|uniref:SOCS box domain-containing protein n=1 Tax=Argiope bruennichi TaxID=94029 RepID=A0A8T0EAI5_ARGBR|nr:hypothetical protein HNY73_017692 [Argiope bruennichi]